MDKGLGLTFIHPDAIKKIFDFFSRKCFPQLFIWSKDNHNTNPLDISLKVTCLTKHKVMLWHNMILVAKLLYSSKCLSVSRLSVRKCLGET